MSDPDYLNRLADRLADHAAWTFNHTLVDLNDVKEYVDDLTDHIGYDHSFYHLVYERFQYHVAKFQWGTPGF